MPATFYIATTPLSGHTTERRISRDAPVSDRHAARLAFQRVSVLVAEYRTGPRRHLCARAVTADDPVLRAGPSACASLPGMA
jgi:hypothetical protein